MNLFNVTNKAGKVILSGFSSKPEAKVARKKLHAESGIDEAKVEDKQKQFIYQVSPGADHLETRRQKNLVRFSH